MQDLWPHVGPAQPVLNRGVRNMAKAALQGYKAHFAVYHICGNGSRVPMFNTEFFTSKVIDTLEHAETGETPGVFLLKAQGSLGTP